MAKKYNLYEEENEVKDKIEYEVAVLPLQNYVSSVRKFVCGAWNSFKVRVVLLIQVYKTNEF